MDKIREILGIFEAHVAGHVDLPVFYAVLLALVVMQLIGPVIDTLNPFRLLLAALRETADAARPLLKKISGDAVLTDRCGYGREKEAGRANLS